jgi:hypothetical protein
MTITISFKDIPNTRKLEMRVEGASEDITSRVFAMFSPVLTEPYVAKMLYAWATEGGKAATAVDIDVDAPVGLVV